MGKENVRQYCLQFPGAYEDFPFGEDTLVIKIGSKMFALINLRRQPESVNLKCNPDEALALREQYEAVIPGYHMNKRHWNTVILDGTIPPAELKAMIRHSYELVFRSLKKSEKDEISKDSTWQTFPKC